MIRNAFGGQTLVALTTAVALVGLPTPASAAQLQAPADPGTTATDNALDPGAPDALERAQQLVNSAQLLYDEGKYGAAAEAYQAAYRLEPTPVLLFNIAVCYDRLDRYEQALDYLERYQDIAPASERPELERRRRSLLARQESQRREQAEPAAEPEETPSAPEPTPTPTKQTTETTDTGSPEQPIFGAAGGALTGVTVAFLALGAGFGGASYYELQQAEAACEQVSSEDARVLCFEDAQGHQDRQRTFGIVADVSFGLAAATGVALITLLAVRASKRRRSRTAWSPSIGPRHAGFNLVHRF